MTGKPHRQANGDIDPVCVVERELGSRTQDVVVPLHEKSRYECGYTIDVTYVTDGLQCIAATVLTGRIVSKPEGGEPVADRSPELGGHLSWVFDARRAVDDTTAWSREDLERSLDLARLCVRLGAGG